MECVDAFAGDSILKSVKFGMLSVAKVGASFEDACRELAPLGKRRKQHKLIGARNMYRRARSVLDNAGFLL